MSERKYFGTDGIRGRVGTEPITPEFALRLGWAVGRVLGPEGDARVVIGKDTRISGYMFESALEAGLAAAGLDVLLTGPMPTPAVAYLTRTFRASVGIVISASHNAFDDNGFKFFGPDGLKLPDHVEQQIETELVGPLQTVAAERLGKASRINDAAGRYIEYCKSTIDNDITLHGLDIVIDCAHGATYQVAPSVLRELGARVSVIGTEPDGLNINLNCGSTHVEPLRAAVRARGADLGIALDGDGDRLIMIDAGGAVIDGDQLLYIVACDRLELGMLDGGVVGTVMSNLGLEKALSDRGVPFERAKVGDRYVLERLHARGWRLGGESSGHLICLDRSTTGDGTVAALQVLSAAVRQQRSLTELTAGMTVFPQKMVNVRVAPGQQPLKHPSVAAAVKAAEAALGTDGRVLLRPSGTEPVVRVMVEGRDASQVAQLVEELAEVVTSVA
ncbi:MAG: phosphoglucosamine mutase [Gammaproteobacteria bacterium]|nr:MAG: phosphoglucosamine mutase [Gammaproteobacteria bacterium]